MVLRKTGNRLGVGGFSFKGLKRISILLIWGLGFSNPNASWLEDYEVNGNFKLEIDSTGFHLPSAIAMVPDPGPNSDSPIYFVTELRGALKVVTRDRSVHTIAEDFFNLKVENDLPDHHGEIGMAGICLHPKTGYVFVTYGYQDEYGQYRNGITRFESEPGTFGLKPKSQVDLLPVLKSYMSNLAHQIGPVQIYDDLVYISVGDGEDPQKSRDVASPKGKILRMTLDGMPAPGNPYAVDEDPNKAINYVWASGLRNPFSLKIADGKVFVGDNGPSADRFALVNEGDDLLYDGTDYSVSGNALFVWKTAVSPVQMDYNPGLAKQAGFPEPWSSSFFVALSGSPTEPPGPSYHGAKALVGLGVDVEKGKLISKPDPLLRYRGSGYQLIVGTALASDGLYVVPLMPDSEGNSPILKLTYDPENAHPYQVNALHHGSLLMKYSCFGCHMFDNKGYSSVGPDINRITIGNKLLEKLNSPDYLEQLKAVDQLKEEPFVSYAAARKEVRDLDGMEKIRTWLTYRLLEPRFDQQIIAMPTLGLQREEAEALADWILEPTSTSVALNEINIFIEKVMYRSKKTLILVFFTGGFFGGMIVLYLGGKIWKRFRT
ncbi:MAG: PQQ-dependent sugar dehydrogenase [Verrucomicrobiae bacterium]|nr:PQQ-dependent sugar dehydrogenase [Verrucomicrobiae bacterium]